MVAEAVNTVLILSACGADAADSFKHLSCHNLSITTNESYSYLVTVSAQGTEFKPFMAKWDQQSVFE